LPAVNEHITRNFANEKTAEIATVDAISFASQEEAEEYRLQKNFAMSDMENFQKFCRLVRIGKMLSPKYILPDNQ
jgi:c-di-AMP phosphodiesterase-like protein